MKKVLDKWEGDPIPYKRQPFSMLSIVPLCRIVMKDVCSLHMSQEVKMMLYAVRKGKWLLGFWWGPVCEFTVKPPHSQWSTFQNFFIHLQAPSPQLCAGLSFFLMRPFPVLRSANMHLELCFVQIRVDYWREVLYRIKRLLTSLCLWCIFNQLSRMNWGTGESWAELSFMQMSFSAFYHLGKNCYHLHTILLWSIIIVLVMTNLYKFYPLSLYPGYCYGWFYLRNIGWVEANLLPKSCTAKWTAYIHYGELWNS